jgi:hypothetical protein
MGGEDSSQIRSSHMGWHLLAMFGFRVGTYFHRRPVMFGLLQIKAVTQGRLFLPASVAAQ